MVNAQNWLDNKYPNKQETKEIKANDSKQLNGSLTIADYPNLEIIHIPDQKNLTQLQIINNEKLEILDVTNNCRLTNLNVQNCLSLKKLYCWDNKLTNLDLSQNLNLEELIIRNYLPKSIKVFKRSADKRKEAKCRIIEEQLAPYKNRLESWRKANKEALKKVQKETWRKKGFSEEEIKNWTDVGIELVDHDFADWLRNIKKVDVEWILNNEEDFKNLKESYKNYGLCEECQQPNTEIYLCQPCAFRYSQQNPEKRISGNPKIDQFIRRLQSDGKQLEWIPYEQFTDIEHIANGGFGKVYKAEWENKKIAFSRWLPERGG